MPDNSPNQINGDIIIAADFEFLLKSNKQVRSSLLDLFFVALYNKICNLYLSARFVSTKHFFVRCLLAFLSIMVSNVAFSQIWTTPPSGLDSFAVWYEDFPVKPSNNATINSLWVSSSTGMSGGSGTTMTIHKTTHGTITYYKMTNISTPNYATNIISGNDYISAQVTVQSSLLYPLRIYKSQISAFWADGAFSGSYLLSLAASDVTGGVPFVTTATPIFKDLVVTQPAFNTVSSPYDPTIGPLPASCLLLCNLVTLTNSGGM